MIDIVRSRIEWEPKRHTGVGWPILIIVERFWHAQITNLVAGECLHHLDRSPATQNSFSSFPANNWVFSWPIFYNWIFYVLTLRLYLMFVILGWSRVDANVRDVFIISTFRMTVKKSNRSSWRQRLKSKNYSRPLIVTAHFMNFGWTCIGPNRLIDLSLERNSLNSEKFFFFLGKIETSISKQ